MAEAKFDHHPGDTCEWPGNWHGRHGKGALRAHREDKRRAAEIMRGGSVDPEQTPAKKRKRRKRQRKASNNK